MTRRIPTVLLLTVLLALGVPASAARAATATVTIGSSLSPKSLSVAPGTTVTWRNSHSERHRMRTTTAPVEFDSDDLEPGESWSFTFRTAGTYRYVDHREEDDSSYWGTVTVSSLSSGGGGGTGGGTGGGGTGGGGDGTAPSTPSSGTVSMAGRVFSPSSIRVAAGGTITFSNDDDRAHTVTARDGSFDSGIVNQGGRYARRFPSAGTFSYFCAVHPEMTGTVTVPSSSGSVPPPAPARPPSGGSGGSGATGGTGGTTGGGAGAPAPGPGSSRPGSARVNVIDFAYSPARLSVHVGDTVSWVNTGQAPHTVTPSGGASFGTSMLAAGATYRTVVSKVGTTPYVCAFHPQMTGTLVVLPKSAVLLKSSGVAAARKAAAPKLAGAGSPGSSGAPSAAVSAPAAATVPALDAAEARPTRRVAATSMWDSPLALWSLGSGWLLMAFLALAWWRGQEPKNA